MMRTTLNLDNDVASQIGALARSKERSLSRVANDLIRAGLRTMRERPALPAYEPPTFDTGEPLVDVTDVAAALDVLDRAG
jgi:hypothetical protein